MALGDGGKVRAQRRDVAGGRSAVVAFGGVDGCTTVIAAAGMGFLRGPIVRITYIIKGANASTQLKIAANGGPAVILSRAQVESQPRPCWASRIDSGR